MDAVSPFHHGHKVRPMFPSLHPTLESVHCGQKHDLHSGLFIKDVDMVSGRERVDRRGGGGGGGERGISEARGGRSRSPLVPLRNRQLPASFWQEPNVPRGYMYPLLPYPVHLHPMAAVWSDSGNNSSKTSGHVQSSKEFLDRLQSAQARGYDLAASRFPITEFLFYNYGLKSYLEPFDAAAATTGHFHRGCPMPEHNKPMTSFDENKG
nr:hypothetical protein BaRGS_020119 [Batillaria attramentaria]